MIYLTIGVMNAKLMLGSVVLLLLFGSVLALSDASYYDVNMKVLSGDSFNDSEVLVFGYINLGKADWGHVLSSDKLSLVIWKGSVRERVYGSSEISYVNDINDSSYLLDGFFFRRVDGLKPGSYNAILYIDGEPKTPVTFNVLSGKTNLTLNLIGASQGSDSLSPIANLDFNNTNPDGTAKTVNVALNVYGRKNFDSPKVIDCAGVATGVNFNVPVTSFSLGDFADEKTVFGVVVHALASDGTVSVPKVLVMDRGFTSASTDGELIVSAAKTVRKGVNDSLSFIVNNTGSLLGNYDVLLSGSLSAYASISGSVSVMPGLNATGVISVNIPRRYSLSTGDLTVTLVANGVVLDEATVSFSLLPASKVHSVSIANLTFDKVSYFDDELIKPVLSIENDGDYAESVVIEYYLSGSSDVPLRKEVTLPAGVKKDELLPLNAVANPGDLIVSVTGDNLVGVVSESKPVSVVTKDYSFSFYLLKDNVISRNALTEIVSLSIENDGNVDDLYTITADYPNYELANRSFVLAPGESVILNATVNVPFNVDAVNMTFSVCSKIGDECVSDLLNIAVFRVSDVVSSVSSVNVTSEVSGDDLVYSFLVSNNKLVAKSYHLSYNKSSDDISVTVYPGVDFVIQPGESLVVYMYASAGSAVNDSISYSVSESGALISSGNLLLASESNGSNLTGFAVAAGGVLGIAGLIVLVLFIYFYFIRQPPVGDDEFKPVEVKKADLTKQGPSVKNDGKYW